MIKKTKQILFIVFIGFPVLMYSQVVNDSVPDAILKESNLQLQRICNKITLDNTWKIIPVLDTTLNVECLFDKSRGETFLINSEKYMKSANKIFDIEFIKKLKSVTYNRVKFINSFINQEGYYFFILSVHYIRNEKDGIKDEYSRIFRFKWDGTKLALELVFCSG